MQRLNGLLKLSPICGTLLLSACSNLGNATLEAGKQAFFSESRKSYQTTPLDPRYGYLEVTTPQASALLVLAYLDEPGVETWVGASQEVIRLQNGHLVSSSGVPKLWSSVQIVSEGEGKGASWLVNSPQHQLYNAPLNLEPVQVESTVNKGLPKSHLGKRAAAVPNLEVKRWFTQAPANEPQLGKLSGLEQIVAIDKETNAAVYGMQCLEKNYCIEYLRRAASRNF